MASTLAIAAPTDADESKSRIEQRAREIAGELLGFCPAADPGDQRAFEACKQGLFGDTRLRASLNDFVLWGRVSDPKLALKDAKLTQFSPDVLTGMYIPLFMFNGKYVVEHVPDQKLYKVRMETAFRNRLAPGQFPYPFWHEANKWAMYENAREVLFWIDPKTERVRFAQFTTFAPNSPIVASASVKPGAFDGQWLWVDDRGRTQPAVTLFDGLYARNNPYLQGMDAAYKKLALRMRESQCFECHVPNNPSGMKKLVLLQTPAHAASEIQRVLKDIREDRMPQDEFGIEQPLSKDAKAAFLTDGEAFAGLVKAARKWETDNKAAAAASPAMAGARAPALPQR